LTVNRDQARQGTLPYSWPMKQWEMTLRIWCVQGEVKGRIATNIGSSNEEGLPGFSRQSNLGSSPLMMLVEETAGLGEPVT